MCCSSCLITFNNINKFFNFHIRNWQKYKVSLKTLAANPEIQYISLELWISIMNSKSNSIGKRLNCPGQMGVETQGTDRIGTVVGAGEAGVTEMTKLSQDAMQSLCTCHRAHHMATWFSWFGEFNDTVISEHNSTLDGRYALSTGSIYRYESINNYIKYSGA